MIILAILFSILMTFVVYAAWMLLIAFTVWMAIDAGKQDRFWWVVLIIGIPFIGSAVYFFTEKKHEYAKVPPHHVHDSQTEEQHEVAPHKHHSRKHKEATEEKKEVVAEVENKNEIKTEENKVEQV